MYVLRNCEPVRATRLQLSPTRVHCSACRVQVSEVDIWSRVLATFTDVSLPVYVSLDADEHLLVADCYNHRILLLNSQLQLLRVLVDYDSKFELWKPKQSCYGELTSQLYVLHSSSTRRSPWSDSVSVINLR